MNPSARISKGWLAVPVLGGALLVALLVGHLLSISTEMARRRQWAEKRVSDRGLALRHRVERANYAAPIGDSARLPPDPDVILKQAALLFAGRVLWAAPPTPAPPLPETPPPSMETVERMGTLWVYAYGIPDGRCLVAAFEVPGLERQNGRSALLAIFESSIALAVLLSAGILSWRAYRPRVKAGDGGVDPVRTGRDEPSTQAVVTLFQQTLKELRRRTEELEEMHYRERNRAEDGERMAEALCANLEAGYLRFGEDGHLSGVNAAARSLLGLQSVPRLGDIAAELLRDRQGVAKVLEEVQTTRALALREEVPGAPGTLLQVVGIPLFNLLHQLKGHLLILRDQTGVYQMRRTLREREALSRLGEVAAGVAHEVRNALSTISARLKLLGQDVPDLAENASFQALAEESRNLEQVMQNLLFFARPLPIEREPIDLLALLEEERGALGTQAEPLEILVQGPPAVVGADREAMGRALRNLTRNSLEAMAAFPPGRRKLVLSTRLERGMAFLRVEDSGPGIPEGVDREAIFTPFFSQKPGGTGLGLAIARKIAREHGGDLVYFPSGPGGAGFELSLPRDSRPA